MEHLTAQEQEDTKRMSALMTLVGETNRGALDTIESLNGQLTTIYQSIVESNNTVTKEYQTTFRSLGNNISEQTKNLALVMDAGSKLEGDVQKMMLSTSADVVKTVVSTLNECFKTVGKLSVQHDKRMHEMQKQVMDKIQITEKVLESLLSNNALYMEKTLDVMNKYGDYILK